MMLVWWQTNESATAHEPARIELENVSAWGCGESRQLLRVLTPLFSCHQAPRSMRFLFALVTMPTKPFSAPIAAEVRQDTESEAALIQAAKEAISTCNWKLGECASMWTTRWAKGRTDEDFGAAVGMTGDQVNQRRRVWERWSEFPIPYRNLSWSHFYAALTWDDAESCLQWAYENHATVSEMKAWRTAQAGVSDTVSESVTMGNSGDPFGSGDDPFGERGGVTMSPPGEDDGQDARGRDSEESAPRPPRNGKDKPGGPSTPPKDPFLTQKAKTVKTIEAGMRAIDDLNDLHSVPNRDAIIKSLCKVIETVKSVR